MKSEPLYNCAGDIYVQCSTYNQKGSQYGDPQYSVALMNNKGEKAVPFPFFERKEGA